MKGRRSDDEYYFGLLMARAQIERSDEVREYLGGNFRELWQSIYLYIEKNEEPCLQENKFIARAERVRIWYKYLLQQKVPLAETGRLRRIFDEWRSQPIDDLHAYCFSKYAMPYHQKNSIQDSYPHAPPPTANRSNAEEIQALKEIYYAEWLAADVAKIGVAISAELRLRELNKPLAPSLTKHTYELVAKFSIDSSTDDFCLAWKIEQELHNILRNAINDKSQNELEYYKLSALNKIIGSTRQEKIKSLSQIIDKCRRSLVK